MVLIMTNKIISLLSIIFLSTLTASASLTWDRDQGWSTEGSIIEHFWGKKIHTRTAIEAMNCAQEHQAAKEYRPALTHFKHVYKRYPDSILAPEALYQTGIIRIERKEYAKAFLAFQKILTDYPSYPKFNDVIQIQFEIASILQKGKRPYYWGVIPGFKDYDAAVEMFESIVTNAPFSYYAPMALMNITDLALEKKNYQDAIDSLDRIITDYPDSPLAPDAYIKLAETYSRMIQGPLYDQGATLEAIKYYEDFLILFPNHEKRGIAEAGLARTKDALARSKVQVGNFYYRDHNNPKAASVFYNEAIAVAPESPSSNFARHQLELIDNGVLPRKTVVDLIFGRYKRPSIPTYLEESFIAKQETDSFIPPFVEDEDELYEEAPIFHENSFDISDNGFSETQTTELAPNTPSENDWVPLRQFNQKSNNPSHF